MVLKSVLTFDYNDDDLKDFLSPKDCVGILEHMAIKLRTKEQILKWKDY